MPPPTQANSRVAVWALPSLPFHRVPTSFPSLLPALWSHNGIPDPALGRVRPFGLSPSSLRPTIGPGHTPGLTLKTMWSYSALRPTHRGQGRPHTALDLLARPRVRQRSLIVLSLGLREAGLGGGRARDARLPARPAAAAPIPVHCYPGRARGPRDALPLRVLGPGREQSPAARAPWDPQGGAASPAPPGPQGHVARRSPEGGSRDASAPLPGQPLRRAGGGGTAGEAGRRGTPRDRRKEAGGRALRPGRATGPQG